MAKKRSQQKRERWREPRFILTVLVAAVIIFIFVITLFAPPTTGTPVTDADIDFNTPVPTVFQPPTPNPDGPQLSFETPTVQTNGLFQVSVPSDWITQRNLYTPGIVTDENADNPAVLSRAELSLYNASRLSFITSSVIFGINYPTMTDTVENIFIDQYWFEAWNGYDGFTETSRIVGEDSAQFDFNLSQGGVDYLGREIVWLVGDWLHSLRLTVPSNNPPLLDALHAEVVPNFISYLDQREKDPAWNGYADLEQGFLIRSPGWQRVSGSPGRPAVFENSSVAFKRLVVRKVDETPLADLDAAEAYAAEAKPQADITGSQVGDERLFGDSAFLVAYQDRDTEGNVVSGLMSLLNDESGALYVADLEVTSDEYDLLQDLDIPVVQEARAVLDGFMILPPEGYVQAPDDALQSVE